MIYIIGDIGSCHNGKKEYAFEAIDVAKECGLDAIKYQLFKGNANGNIELPREWWKDLVAYAKQKDIEIFASVFDKEAVDLLWSSGCRKVKISYSQNFNLELLKRVRKHKWEIVASGAETYPSYADIKLFCIPEYPVKHYNWALPYGTAFWDGFSSHYLGKTIDKLVIENSEGMFSKKIWGYIEKHFTLDHDDIDCPDSLFALNPRELKEYTECLKSE